VYNTYNVCSDEYIDVLTRMGLGETHELGKTLSLFRTGYNRLFTVQMPSLSISTDADDNEFIEAAVALDAEIIISGDKHLKKTASMQESK